MKIPFTSYSINLIKAKRKTVLHPDVSEMVEYAFSLKDKDGMTHDYYKFINPNNMPYKRWLQLMTFKEEADINMTKEEMNVLIKLGMDCINHNPILISGVMDVLKIFQYTNDMFQDMSALESMMTCYFFDMTLNEDVTDYDEDLNKQKAEIFRSQPPDSFFFKKPVQELLPLVNPSLDDIQVFLKQTKIKETLMKQAVEGIRENLNISQKQEKQEG